jgi:hypothetical protein
MKSRNFNLICLNEGRKGEFRRRRLAALCPTLLALAIAQTLTIPGAHAATITVNNELDAVAGCTLREAVESFNDGSVDGSGCVPIGMFGVNDEIKFAASISSITLSNGHLDINNNLSINGGTSGVTIISASNDRVFTLNEGGTIFNFDKLTLTGGSIFGGAIFMSNVSVNLSNCTLQDNSGFIGGGVRADDGSSLSLINSMITGNSSYSYGGGLAINNSHLSLVNSTVSGNSSNSGGGVFVSSSTMITMNNSEVSGNSAQLGGGIFTRSNSTVNLSDTQISGNSTSGPGARGAGLYVWSSTMTLNNSTVSRNTAAGGTMGNVGGGIFTRNTLSIDGTRLDLISSTISENSAYSGGGIYNSFSTVFVNNSTVSANLATEKGGGIFIKGSSVSLNNSSISGNSTVSGGGGLYVTSSGTSSPSNVDLINSTVSGNSASIGAGINAAFSNVNLHSATVSENSASSNGGGLFVGSGSSVTLNNSILANSGSEDCDISGNSSISTTISSIIEDDGCGTLTDALHFDPLLGPLANNGGPTQTHALLKGSLAIKAGDNAACSAAPVNNRDQRGEPRPAGGICDIGAYEFGAGASFFVVPLPNGKSVIFEI